MSKTFFSIFILCALAWTARAAIGLYDADYWDPQTPLDYAAVASLSLALVLLAVSLWGLYRQHPLPTSRKQKIWHAGMYLAIVASLVVGIENFVEDWFGVGEIGILFPVGMVALLLGLLIAGITALFVPEIRHPFGWSLLVIGYGMVSIETHGGFLTGMVLVGLALWPKGKK